MAQRTGLTWIVPQLLVFMTGCAAGTLTDSTTEGTTDSALSVPGKVKVDGKVVDVESNYLPRVVQCENPNAPIEAMKAQAIAARTWLAHETAGKTTPTVGDGQSDQVYSCPANNHGTFVSDNAELAVSSTAGMVVTWNGRVSAGFFVAGDTRDSGSCRKISDSANTERFVTYNFGAVADAVEPSSIGNENNPDNRGCMSQNLANCMADAEAYDHETLLRYFYGSDIVVGSSTAAAMGTSAAAKQSDADLDASTCFSDAWRRYVQLDECIQSGAQRQWYQCRASGKLVLVTTASDGSPEGSPSCVDVSYY